jgi:hypothetical protein
MRMPRKMKLVKEVADLLKKEGEEVNAGTINSKVMGYVYSGATEAGKYEALTPGDASRFMREFYEHE